tara:strand:+ start:5142 stop:5450 length:309 start_codon:yes stop_codon:yes gene_type:complete
MKDRITVDLHPCTKVDAECAKDQMAIYLDGDLLIGYASTAENGCISLIVTFDDEDVPIIRDAVSKLMGVKHDRFGMVPNVPDEYEDYDDIENDNSDEDGESE